MSFDLTPFKPAPVMRAGDAPIAPSMVSTKDLMLTGGSGANPQFPDLPAPANVPDPTAGPVMAESIDDLGGHFAHQDGRTCIPEVAWRAYMNQIVVFWVHREAHIAAGVAHPKGARYIHDQRVFVPTAPVARTTGVVAPDSNTISSADSDKTMAASGIPSAFFNGHHATSFLPSVVQAGMVSAVRQPALWAGGFVQRAEGGEPDNQRVNVLRMDENTAVAIHATRSRSKTGATVEKGMAELDQAPWTITQLTYDLRQPVALEQGKKPRLLGWKKNR